MLVSWFACATMAAEDCPRRWLEASWIHVSPQGGSVETQWKMVQGLRSRGWIGSLSVGTFLRGVRQEPEDLRALLGDATVLFLNEAEAQALFQDNPPPTGLVVYETRGREGVRVHQEGAWTDYAPPPVEVLDPTGAGDALCGGVLLVRRYSRQSSIFCRFSVFRRSSLSVLRRYSA